jgi:hypothetical protein
MNELEMRQTGTDLITMAKTYIVETEQEYKNAVEICKDIKSKIKVIEQYWEGLKSQAHKAWKDICTKEKELLEPYTKAETDIKTKMQAWQRAKMEEERLLREEQERYRKEEEARLLALAVEAEKEGKELQVEALIEKAEEIHTAVFKQPEKIIVTGSAVKKVWKYKIVNPALVPIELNGFNIRPIDESILKKIATGTKGQMKVPGVEFFEDVEIAVSRG